MRLREMKEILLNNVEYLQLNERMNPSNNALHDISDVHKTIDALIRLGEFEFLQPLVFQAQNYSNIFSSRLDITTVDTGSFQGFNTILKNINTLIDGVVSAIEQVLPEQNELSISVKLPPINQLSELVTIVKDLDTSLNQTFSNKHFEGNISLQNFESGSNWLEITIGSIVVMKALGDFIRYAIDVRLKILEAKKATEVARAAKLSTKVLEDLEQGLNSNIKTLCEANAKEFLNKNNITDNDLEYINRVTNSIKTVAELFNDGMEIHHSLNAPKEVKEQFPDLKSYKSLISDVQKLMLTDDTSQK